MIFWSFLSLKKCPDSSNYCDKTIQNVDGEVRIVRSCLTQEPGSFTDGCRYRFYRAPLIGGPQVS